VASGNDIQSYRRVEVFPGRHSEHHDCLPFQSSPFLSSISLVGAISERAFFSSSRRALNFESHFGSIQLPHPRQIWVFDQGMV